MTLMVECNSDFDWLLCVSCWQSSEPEQAVESFLWLNYHFGSSTEMGLQAAGC